MFANALMQPTGIARACEVLATLRNVLTETVSVNVMYTISIKAKC